MKFYVSTGEALSTLGDQDAAMERFRKALGLPGSDRVGVRLAIAQLMAQQGHREDAERQIALALDGSRGRRHGAAKRQPVHRGSGCILVRCMITSFRKPIFSAPRLAGAPDAEVRIGLANNYLALGDTVQSPGRAFRGQPAADGAPDYQYLLAEANVFRQEHHNAQALTRLCAGIQRGGRRSNSRTGHAPGRSERRIESHSQL